MVVIFGTRYESMKEKIHILGSETVIGKLIYKATMPTKQKWN